jgi:hypothetical protein
MFRSVDRFDTGSSPESRVEPQKGEKNMSNGNGEERYNDVVKSKAALDAARSYRRFMELLEAGWSREKAFQVAFMGVHLLEIPGLKPVPEPDPPFEAESLVAALQVAHERVSLLLKDIEADMAFIQKHPPH